MASFNLLGFGYDFLDNVLRIQKLLNRMTNTRIEYFFAFSLTKLELLDDIHLSLDPFTRFRIDILNSCRPIAASKQFSCSPNQHDEVILNQIMQFRIGEQRQGSQLRLMMISEDCGEKTIGRYQFQLANYVRAYEQLRRNCVQLSVQIAPQYAIIYDVFLERSAQALDRIIRQHQAAVRFNMHAEILSEIDSFLPHEITNSNLEEIFRDIRIDQASPLLLNQRYWSPKKARLGLMKRLSIISKGSQQVQQGSSSSLNVNGNRISLLKLSKSASTFSDLQFSKNHKHSITALNIQEIDFESQAQTIDHHRELNQLYEVIKSDSKISPPQQLEHGVQEGGGCQKNGEAAEKQKKIKRSTKNKYLKNSKYVVLAVILITIMGFFLFLFDEPSLNFKKRKNRKYRIQL